MTPRITTVIILKTTKRAVLPGDYRAEGRKAARKIRKPPSNTKMKNDNELSPELYAVARKGGTEGAFKGKYWNEHDKGMYKCAIAARNFSHPIPNSIPVPDGRVSPSR